MRKEKRQPRMKVAEQKEGKNGSPSGWQGIKGRRKSEGGLLLIIQASVS